MTWENYLQQKGLTPAQYQALTKSNAAKAADYAKAYNSTYSDKVQGGIVPVSLGDIGVKTVPVSTETNAWDKLNPTQTQEWGKTAMAEYEAGNITDPSKFAYNGKLPDSVQIGKDGAGLGTLYRNSDGTISQVGKGLLDIDISGMNQAEFTNWAERNPTQAAQLGNDIKFNDAGVNIGTGMTGTEPNWLTQNAKGLEAGAAVANAGLGLASYLDQRGILKKQKELLGQQIADNRQRMADRAERNKSLGDIRLS